MNRGEREAYQAELKRVAKHLGLAQSSDMEKAIIQHCLSHLREWLVAHGQPQILSDLVDDFATSLGMQLEEVHSQTDMDALLHQMGPEQKPVIAALKTEFDEDTDAVTVLRVHRKPWEPAYLAIINCQGWHEFRRYFSKWHEISHRLLEGQQLTFALRHTRVERLEPEEILVDRVAAALAFYPDIFEPVVREECERDGRLTFGAIDRVHERVVPDASREATARACLRYCSMPVWFLRCAMGLKREEERRLNSSQMRMLPEELPEPKLRIRAAAYSPAAENLGIRFHPNMQVPESSIVGQVFRHSWGVPDQRIESLDAWETSSGGPIGYGMIKVEAERVGSDEVWALVYLLEEHHGDRARSVRQDKGRGKSDFRCSLNR